MLPLGSMTQREETMRKFATGILAAAFAFGIGVA
jgi:hypothetical protein